MAYMLKPSDFGGWGRKSGPGGGLEGVEFSSHCPPAIKPCTRIIAVCGITDFGNASSPHLDGWFHSDFYLFHYLFSGLSSNQIWLTSVEPAYLVSKYGEFVHGNRLEMRRVVLSAEILPGINSAQNIRVIKPAELLERFLATLRSECRLAALNEESVLVLIFGHGDDVSYGVEIGGKTDANTAPRLTIKTLNTAIGNTPKVSLVMTSCFSGGWVTKATADGSRAMLNATVMAAAGPEKVSESWAKSESSGRAAGSIYASALVKAAIEMQIADQKEVEDEEEIESSLAYAGWAKFIHDVGRDEVDRMFWKHEIKFAAQNDSWDSEWRNVSGLPATDYKGKWETLRTIPKDTANPITNRSPHADFEGDMANLSLGEPGSTVLGQEFRGSFLNIVREQARQYLNSFPGNDASGCNSHHGWFQLLVKGEVYDREYLEFLSNILCYRMSMMAFATDLKDYLDLPIPDAHMFDTWAWEQKTLEACDIKDPDINRAKEPWTRYEAIRHAILTARVFDPPTRSQGFSFTKPSEYLAIAFYQSGRSKEQILSEIQKLAVFKGIMVGYLEKRVLKDPTVQRQNHRFFRTFHRLGKRLRSLSPSKGKEKRVSMP